MDSDRTKIAAVGDLASVLLFNALGISAVGAETPQDVEREITRLVSEGYSVIFITEKTAAGVPELINKYKSQTFPAIIPIPDKDGSDGSGLRAIRANVEKAVGKNIF
ncbi:MAG: V-type ATP synthase subunit F [Clostridia bacterium]|nr:V-type ATP synthase subunit F [Clostridia bacterium]